jgi:hypothetical protein
VNVNLCRWFAIAVLLIALSFACVGAGDEWPPIEKGRWDLEIRPRRADRQTKGSALTRDLCNDPSAWFSRYPSATPLARSGCRFSSRRIDGQTYEVKSECALLKGGIGIARGVVNLGNTRSFQAEWEVTENNKSIYREQTRGIWRQPCATAPPR